jgi:hypothetical protein
MPLSKSSVVRLHCNENFMLMANISIFSFFFIKNIYRVKNQSSKDTDELLQKKRQMPVHLENNINSKNACKNY